MSPKNTTLTLPNLEAIETAMGNLACAEIRLQSIRAEQSQKLAAITQEYTPRLSAVLEDIEVHETLIQLWAKKHPEAFAKSKTLQLRQGAIKKRIGSVSVDIISEKHHWGHVLARLKKLGGALAKKYVHVTEDVNRQALIADRDQLDKATLTKLGLKFVQKETISVIPKVD